MNVTRGPDHPRGNYWFADRVNADEGRPGFDERWPWLVFLQCPGFVAPLGQWFQTKEDAEDFIRDDILGAPGDDDIYGPRVVPGVVVYDLGVISEAGRYAVDIAPDGKSASARRTD